ncbi:MAG: hypothetical protein KDF64_02250 [Geminicoccaceae bacterium]|nr:hypothetical protein [Geminicoccaceae bacterium]
MPEISFFNPFLWSRRRPGKSLIADASPVTPRLSGRPLRPDRDALLKMARALREARSLLMRSNWGGERVAAGLMMPAVEPGPPADDNPVTCAHTIPFNLLCRELENDDLRFFTRLLHRAAQIQSNFAFEDVFQFSDAPATRAEDIVNLYDMALALLRDETRNVALSAPDGRAAE